MIFDIKRVRNGLTLQIVDHDDDGSPIIVYQEKFENEIECFADFLRQLNIEFGPSTSRYSEKRIYVTVEPGDKFEDIQDFPSKAKKTPQTKKTKSKKV